MRLACCGAAVAILLSACKYEVTHDVPDASGPFAGAVTLTWAPSSLAVTANFTEVQVGNAGACVGTQIGSCCAYSQPAINLTSGGTEPITVSAGTLNIDDGATPIGLLNFAGIGYLTLSSAESQNLLWNPGDTLTVSATGALMPAFSGAITAPPPFEAVTPPLSLENQVVIPVTDDFAATWTPGAAGGGNVTLSLSDPTGFYVDCSAPDSAGSITVPAAALASFQPGDNGYVTLIRSAAVALPAGNSSVTLSAQATAPGLAHFQ